MNALLFALLLMQDKAIVEGTILNAVTDEPVRKAGVTLNAKKSYSVLSSNDGKFRFEGVDPSEYQLRVHRQGFLDADDEPSIEVSSGQQVKDFVVKLTPQGIIAGRVVDEDGDPLEDAEVDIERSLQLNGRKVSLSSDSDRTNTEGYFFIGGLKAGLYRISATPQDSRRPLPSGPREDFVRTEDPLPIHLAPGAAIRDVEIRVRKSPVFRVRGHVSNAKEYGHFILSGESQSYGATFRDGAFAFESVAPGSYTLTVSPSFITRPDHTLARPTLFCHLPVTVSDHDIDGIALELAPGPNVDGNIKIDGDARFDKPPRIAVTGSLGFEWVTAKEDGTFGWTGLVPSEHPLIFMAPDGFYTKSIQFNHQPVTNSRIDLSSGAGGTLEIVIAPNPATVSATITDGKNAKVALWNDAAFETSDADATGVAKFTHLAPGEYRIAAWQKVDPEFLRVPEFRARFDAQKITLAEGSHVNVEVKPVPKSSSDAEVAKLQ
jgi:Carboxypeptidase regulatory-like domain